MEEKKQRHTSENVNEFEERSVGSLLLKFSIPAIIGLVCNALQNIINRVFVGNEIGSVALAAVTVSFPVMIIFMALSILVGAGSTTLASIRLGQHRKDEAEQLLGHAVALLFLFPILLLIICCQYIEPILLFLGATESVLPYAKDYLSVVLFAMVFACPSMGLNNFIRTEGSPRIAMGTQILASAINILLNYVFVVRLGYGVKGAAYGILFGNLISLFWIFGFFASKNSYLKVRFKYFIIKPRLLLKIAVLGMAPFLMQMASFVQQLIMNRTLVNYGGDNALAAIGIISSLSTLLIMPNLGLNQGAQPIIGYNYGAKLYERIKKVLGKAVFYATAFSVCSFIIVQLFPEQLVSIFAKDEPEVIELTAHALQVFFFGLPVIGFQMICAGYFQATGKPIQAAILSLSRQVLLFIPLLLILPPYLGLEGAWLSGPLSDIIASLITAVFIFVAMKKLNKQIIERDSLLKAIEDIKNGVR